MRDSLSCGGSWKLGVMAILANPAKNKQKSGL